MQERLARHIALAIIVAEVALVTFMRSNQGFFKEWNSFTAVIIRFIAIGGLFIVLSIFSKTIFYIFSIIFLTLFTIGFAFWNPILNVNNIIVALIANAPFILYYCNAIRNSQSQRGLMQEDKENDLQATQKDDGSFQKPHGDEN